MSFEPSFIIDILIQLGDIAALIKLYRESNEIKSPNYSF